MSDFIPIGHAVRWRIIGELPTGKRVFNVGHCYSANILPDATDVENVAGLVEDWCNGSYKGIISTSVTVVQVDARSAAEEPGPVAYHTGLSIAGTRSGQLLPTSTTLAATWRTGKTGYSQHARFNVFPATEGETDAGLYNAAYATDVVTALLNLRSEASALGYFLSIASRRHLTLYEIETVTTNRIPAHLRSRRVDRGI